MWISPQRRAIFGHLNFQKWSEPTVFCTFWLANVLFATAAYNFSASVLPKVVPDRQFFNIFTSECAFRHSGVPGNFSTVERQKMLRGLQFFNILTFKCAFRHSGFQKWSEPTVFCTFWLANVLFATAAYNFSASVLPKVVPDRQFFNIFTSECAFRHSGVQFFDIWTSKSGPRLWCFAHFELRMCFSPQRRAIFGHLNFQKWSEPTVFCTFWLANVLFATAAYNFSASVLPKVVPDRQFFNIFTSECAFRHSGVQFFDIWTSKSGPRLWCFAHFELRMCFSPQRRAIFDVTSQHLPPHPPL